jgi:hypothetical protein
MDLECLQQHMRGQKVRVEGTLYTVGTDGILRDVPEKDGKELLGMHRCWRAVVAKTAAPAQKLAEAAQAAKEVKPEPAKETVIALPATPVEKAEPEAAPSAQASTQAQKRRKPV